MPHVDDGILHAWLDGAIDALDAAGELPAGMTKGDVVSHLSTCPDCRARLEAERDIRERAGLVLHDVSLPHIVTPDFASLAAAAPARRRQRRALPLTWAASVLLAVGAGWWGSAQWRAQMPDAFSAPESVAETAAARDGASDAGRQTGQSAAAAAPAPAVAGSQEEGAGGTRRFDAEASSVAGDVPPATTVAPAAAPPPASAAAPPPVRTEAAAEQAALARRDAATDSALADARTPSERRADLDRLTSQVSSGETGRPLGVQAAQVASDAFRLTDAASTTVYLVPDTELRAFDEVLLRARTGEMRWTAIPADRDSGVAPLFVIDGASDPRIERAQYPDSTSVRITQTLASGVPVELLVWRQEAVVMSEVVTTGAVAASRERASSPRAARAPEAPPRAAAADATANKALAGSAAQTMVTTGASRVLPDGRRELVLRSSASPVWVALRAHLTDTELQDLAARLVVLDQRR